MTYKEIKKNEEVLAFIKKGNSHPETRHQGVMFRSPWAFVDISLTLQLLI